MSAAGPRIPGEFVPLSVNYAHDPALRRAGTAAELLFIRGLAESRLRKSHGFLAEFTLSGFAFGIRSPLKAADALVREGAWVKVSDGWRITAWDKWNPRSEADVHEKQSSGGALGAHNKWHVDGRRSDDCRFCGPMGPDG